MSCTYCTASFQDVNLIILREQLAGNITDTSSDIKRLTSDGPYVAVTFFFGSDELLPLLSSCPL